MDKHTCPKNKSVSRNGRLFVGCDSCLTSKLHQGDSAGFERRWQQIEYRRDITQPTDPRNFIKAYGTTKSKEYYDDETIRKYA